jgi:hypothetical protein
LGLLALGFGFFLSLNFERGSAAVITALGASPVIQHGSRALRALGQAALFKRQMGPVLTGLTAIVPHSDYHGD